MALEEIRIRPAEPGDAEGLARAHVASWQTAYRGLIDDAFLDALDPADRVETWTQRIRSAGADGRRMWVATSGDAIVGFAVFGPCRDADRMGVAGAWELYSIYLRPEAWNRGAGRALLETGWAALPPGAGDVTLWVLAGNARARAFYERQGFRPDGREQTITIGGQDLVEVRYARRREPED